MKGGLASRLAIFSSLVALVATATVGFMVYRGAETSLMRAASERVGHTAENVRVRVWVTLEGIGNDVKFLAETPPVQGIVRAKTRRSGLDPELSIWDYEWGAQLAEIFQAFLVSRASYVQARFIGLENGGRELVRVERVDGKVVFAESSDLQGRADADYFKETTALPRGSIYYSGVRWGGEGRLPRSVPVIFVATPVYSADGILFGLVIVSVDFRRELSPIVPQINPNQRLYVADSEGRWLLISGDSLSRASHRMQEVFPAAKALVNGSEDVLRLMSAETSGGERGIAYFTSLPLGAGEGARELFVGVTEPHASILAGVRAVRNESALITILLCIAAIVVALAMSRHVTQPLTEITRAVDEFGKEGLRVPLPVGRNDEIGVLARAFEGMEQQIEVQIAKLADDEGRQRTILETSAEGIVVTDLEGNIETFNSAAEEIFGCTADEVIGTPVWSLIRLKKDGANEWIDIGAGEETTGICRNGDEIPLSVAWSTFSWAGERKYTILIQDISERKEAEAAREQLVKQLEAERATLRELSATLEERVQQRTADLERVNLDLESSNRELRDIANVASHDLQEPLRKLRSFADLLATEHAQSLSEEGRFYVQRIFRLAERMSDLISDLLAFTRIAGEARPFEKVDLEDVARYAVSGFEDSLSEVGGRVNVHDLPTIEADPMEMRVLLENLLSNAIKYRRPEVPPHVEVRAHVEDGDQPLCRIEVADNGVGFDPKYVDRIFAPFERLNDRRGPEGTGMGLAICRRIAENHRGSITAQSEVGRGSTFIVTLPLRQGSNN